MSGSPTLLLWPESKQLRHCSKSPGVIVALVLLLGATRVSAVDFDGSAALVSDYRFRGLSLSNGKPVAEASVEASVAAGWFAGLEAVSSSSVRSPVRAPRSDAEVDLSAGWSRSFGLLTPTAGVIGYLHPGGGEPLNAEVFGTLEGALGPAIVTVGANYAPAQTVVPKGDFYVFGKAVAGIPATPVSLKASIGRETGAFARGHTKIDYSGGVDVHVGFVTLGLEYVANNLPAAAVPLAQRNRSSGFVGSVTARF